MNTLDDLKIHIVKVLGIDTKDISSVEIKYDANSAIEATITYEKVNVVDRCFDEYNKKFEVKTKEIG